MKGKRRILICPLNWGLGHATRCIPIIEALLNNNAEVLIASDGIALSFLREEYPQLRTFELPAYGVRYESENMLWNMATQTRQVIRAINKEYMFIAQLVKDQQFDFILSDNRFGCFSKNIHSIFMTHQVHITTPYFWTDGLVNFFNNRFIQRFDECWIPDNPGKLNLAGKLSSNAPAIPSRYIGPLSRMQVDSFDKTYDLCAILSGPEPQRTRLEEILIDQLSEMDCSILLVRGKMDGGQVERVNDKFQVVPYLTTEALNKAILKSNIVISRSGYSSIMDYAKLGNKAILIPTPGQTEQEYLARKLEEKKIFFVQQQSQVNLKRAIEETRNYTGFSDQYFKQNKVNEVVCTLLQSV